MKIALVFPGQGSQHVGMGSKFHDASQLAREIFGRASKALGYDMAALCFEGPEDELNRTERTQPALVTTSFAALTVLRAEGVEPALVAGHSLGEYSALVAAGALGLEEALKLTELRGQLMQNAVPKGKGKMAAILGLGRRQVDSACEACETGYVASANYNCPGQIVVSGEAVAVDEAMDRCKQAGAKRATRVNFLEIVRAKTFDLEQRHGQTVADRHLDRGRGGRCQTMRAGFFGFWKFQHDIGGLAQC